MEVGYTYIITNAEYIMEIIEIVLFVLLISLLFYCLYGLAILIVDNISE